MCSGFRVLVLSPLNGPQEETGRLSRPGLRSHELGLALSVPLYSSTKALKSP